MIYPNKSQTNQVHDVSKLTLHNPNICSHITVVTICIMHEGLLFINSTQTFTPAVEVTEPFDYSLLWIWGIHNSIPQAHKKNSPINNKMLVARPLTIYSTCWSNAVIRVSLNWPSSTSLHLHKSPCDIFPTHFHWSLPHILSHYMFLSDNSFPQHALLTAIPDSIFTTLKNQCVNHPELVEIGKVRTEAKKYLHPDHPPR